MTKTIKKAQPLTHLFKLALGLMLGTFILKFIFGLDASSLIHAVTVNEKISLSDEFQATVLLIKTLIQLPLSIGLGIFLVELLDMFTLGKFRKSNDE